MDDAQRPCLSAGETTFRNKVRNVESPIKTKSSQNIMSGKWLAEDQTIVLSWIHREMINARLTKEYINFKQFFPDVQSVDEEIRNFVNSGHKITEIQEAADLKPSIVELLEAMDKDMHVGQLLVKMFREQTHPHSLNTRDSLFLINRCIRKSPRFVSKDSGEIPMPIVCILYYTMVTPSGLTAFASQKINQLFQNILIDYQRNFLVTEASLDILRVDDPPQGGWFSPQALEEIPDFDQTFVCDPSKPYKGFKSFDDFFTRRIRAGIRPIESPGEWRVITNACENAPFRISHQIAEKDSFWIKTQPYSLKDLLKDDTNLQRFVGGTIYQGLLTPHVYHRFHAPVSGTIIRSDVIPGLCFSQITFDDQKMDYPECQPYLAHVATRGVVLIDTKTPLGMVGFIAIGMTEVSSVELSIKTGDNVMKGQDIGAFHFGGSSHILMFEKNVNVHFDLQGIKPDPVHGSEYLKVNTKIANFVGKYS
ncbi:uncharacterized protein [Clytia hemisphaerica]|uniref:L-tryptophan decarboxylase PsiD-like domain-containing protein n=1 Tax=Clytia hemisphaerica TaxID=252671 RepID=A0A7M5UU96_9CNID